MTVFRRITTPELSAAIAKMFSLPGILVLVIAFGCISLGVSLRHRYFVREITQSEKWELIFIIDKDSMAYRQFMRDYCDELITIVEFRQICKGHQNRTPPKKGPRGYSA